MTFLDVPFREKDEAKSLGARWDAISKRWYVPVGFKGDMSLFDRWLKQESLEQSDASGEYGAELELPDILEAQTEKKGVRLSQVLTKVQMTLKQGFAGGVWIVAEIANINTRKGHVYLELTETSQSGQVIASCRAMIWQRQAGQLLQRFELETGSALAIGQKILILAEVNFHEQYGFSFVIQDLDPNYTLGELEQRVNEIRKSLIRKGVYQLNKQLSVSPDFFRVAVIAPPEAAGLGDFRADADILQKSNLCEFKYFYSSFQGESVEKEMLAALDAVQALNQAKAFDVLVIIRGGGAKLDLNMLNIEIIAEVLCQLSLPVFSGIGHERDNTILDEVAHTRFDTPSKVIGYITSQIVGQAKLALSNWTKIEQSSRLQVQKIQQLIVRLNNEITQNSQNCIYRWQKQVEPLHFDITRLSQSHIGKISYSLDAAQQKIQSEIKQKIARSNIEINQLRLSVEQNAKRAVEIQKQQIIQSIAFVLSSGPKTQLNRGFSLVLDEQGKPITTAHNALQHEQVKIEFSDGVITAKIDNKKITEIQ